MSVSLNDIEVTAADWVDLHITSGAASGAAGMLFNKSSTWFVVFQSATKPASTSFDGIPVQPAGGLTGVLEVPADATNKTWIRAVQGSGRLNFSV